MNNVQILNFKPTRVVVKNGNKINTTIDHIYLYENKIGKTEMVNYININNISDHFGIVSVIKKKDVHNWYNESITSIKSNSIITKRKSVVGVIL